MKIVVFGASGRTGRPLVEQALAAGHHVTAFVRDPARLETRHERLTVVQGDVHDAARVREAVAGQEAVLSTLGLAPKGPRDVVSAGTRAILAAMREHGVSRVVCESGAGVRTERDSRSAGATAMTTMLKLVARDVLRDAEASYQALKASDRAWVFVRAPRLTEGPRTGQYRTGYLQLGPGATISRADVADFMLKELTDDTYLKQAPMVSY